MATPSVRTFVLTAALALPVSTLPAQGVAAFAAPSPTLTGTPSIPPATTATAVIPQAGIHPTDTADPLLNHTATDELGDLYTAKGRYLAAIRVYEALPPTALRLNKIGIACEHMLMFEKARGSFLAAIKLEPKYSEAYNNLGTLAHTQNDLRGAEKMYKKALKLKPQAANTLQNLGTLYYSERKYKKGDEAYRKALAIDPQIMERSAQRGIQTQTRANSASEIHYHLAANYASAGSQKLAIVYLRKAILEGFRDKGRLLHDKEFADMRTTPVFLQMVDDLAKN